MHPVVEITSSTSYRPSDNAHASTSKLAAIPAQQKLASLRNQAISPIPSKRKASLIKSASNSTISSSTLQGQYNSLYLVAITEYRLIQIWQQSIGAIVPLSSALPIVSIPPSTSYTTNVPPRETSVRLVPFSPPATFETDFHSAQY